MSEVVIEGTDGRGNPLRLHRHDEYARSLYCVSYTDADGQRVFTTLMSRQDADWKYHEMLMSDISVRLKPLTELVLPQHYSVIVDADGLELLAPGGERIALFGEAYSVVAVEDVAWLHEEDARTGFPADEEKHVIGGEA